MINFDFSKAVGLDIQMNIISMYIYLVAFILFLAFIIGRNKTVGRVASGVLILGFIPTTISFLWRWIELERIPLANMSEFAVSMVWMAVLSFIVLLYKFKEPIIGAFIAPLTFMTMFTAVSFYTGLESALVPALQSNWLTWHVLLAAIGSGTFMVSAGVSVAFLIKNNMEQKDKTDNVLYKMLPNKNLLDEINYKTVSIGYPLYTLGALFFGAIWAFYAWGNFWGWDPKEIGALVIWLFYSAYLHARYKKDWRGNKAAWMSIIGFLLVALSFFGNNFLGGNHAYG